MLTGGGLLTGTGSSTYEVSHATGNNGLVQCASGSGLVHRAPPTVTLVNRVSTSGVRCFGCGEIGHRQANCKK